MSAETYIPARELARRIGVKTGTLSKWRFLKKGPPRWVRLSETLVVYPASGVDVWIEERSEGGRDRPSKPAATAS